MRLTVDYSNNESSFGCRNDACGGNKQKILSCILSVVDAFTRECLVLEADTSLGSGRVTRELDRLIERRGQPESVRSDNGPEFTSRRMLGWAEERKISLIHIQPGRPMQNPYVAYCTSLDDCGKNCFEAARSWSLMPCCFRGGLSSGS